MSDRLSLSPSLSLRAAGRGGGAIGTATAARFAVIEVPHFALQAVLRAEAGLRGRALVLVEGTARRSVVVAASAAAEAEAVRVGMTASQALGRCGGLVVRPRSPGAESLAEGALAACAFTLSPRVEATAEGVFTIDLSGVAVAVAGAATATGADGGLERLGAKAVGQLGRLGLEGRVGIAPTPALAGFAARCARPVLVAREPDGFLERLPLEVAVPSPALRGVLVQWGLRTAGEFVGLPREEVGRRFGAEGLDAWDEAAGREVRLLRHLDPPERFEAGLELEYEIETLEPLLFILRRFLEQLALGLGHARRAARQLHLQLRLADGGAYQRSFDLPEPTREVEALFRVLHTHLETVQADAPVVAARLEAVPAEPRPRQAGLFDTAVKNPRRFADTVSRLAAVAGRGQVGSPRPGDSHRPDSFRMDGFDLAPGEPGAGVEPPGEGEGVPPPPGRTGLPLRRFRPPLPARVRLEHHRPAAFSSPAGSGEITACQGPWRTSGTWWDAGRWSREEWDVERTSGGLFRLVLQRGEWSVEGTYG